VQIVGEFLTVSSVQNWLIKTDDGTPITVRRGQIGGNDVRGLAVGTRVRVVALMKIEPAPGGRSRPPTWRKVSTVSPTNPARADQNAPGCLVVTDVKAPIRRGRATLQPHGWSMAMPRYWEASWSVESP
jgi:hypothetical protein